MSQASREALKRGVTPTHELMGDWILENPGGTLREMGAYFGYSVSWLSTMMQSDAFKAYIATRLGEVHASVTQDIPAKMRALAELSIERMTEVMDTTSDADVIKDSFDKVMNRYGYSAGVNRGGPLQPGGFQQQNNFFLSPTQHAAVREKLINSHSNPVAEIPKLVRMAQEHEESPPQPDAKEEIPSGG